MTGKPLVTKAELQTYAERLGFVKRRLGLLQQRDRLGKSLPWVQLILGDLVALWKWSPKVAELGDPREYYEKWWKFIEENFPGHFGSFVAFGRAQRLMTLLGDDEIGVWASLAAGFGKQFPMLANGSATWKLDHSGVA